MADYVRTIMSEFLTIDELAQYLNVKKSTLYAMVESKEIPCFRFGRLIRFRKEEIDGWVENHRQKLTDPEKKATEVIKGLKRPEIDINRVVEKAVEWAKKTGYNLAHGKPDRLKGLRKEVEHGSI